MGIACLLRATSCPISTLLLPEHCLTSRADSTQYSAKQMRVKKRNPIDTGLFPCTACMCDSTACCEGEASYSRGERSSDKAERGYAWPWTHFMCWVGEQAAATTCKWTRLIKAGRQADRDRGTRSGSAWWAHVSAPWRASVDTLGPLTAVQDGGGDDVSLSFLKEGRRDKNRNK